MYYIMTKDEFKEILSDLDISQAKYSRLIGVTNNTVHYWLTGRQNISGVAERMALLLHDRPELIQVLEQYEPKNKG